MRTARPAARPPHPFFEFRAHPFDVLPPCLIFLDGDGPADPLVARQRRNVFPRRQRLCVGRERLAEIGRKVMRHSSGDSNSCHRWSRRLMDQKSDTRLQPGSWDYRQVPAIVNCPDDSEWSFIVEPDTLLSILCSAILQRHTGRPSRRPFCVSGSA